MRTDTEELSHQAGSRVDENVAYEASLAYFDGDELAATSWLNKYALRDLDGSLLEATPRQMFERLADRFAAQAARTTVDRGALGPDRLAALSRYGRERPELDRDRVLQLFDRYRFVIPQGSVQFSLGNPYYLGSLSNCVVLPSPHDSYGGVLYTDQQGVQLHKRRSGVGLDVSTLRPNGSVVRNATGVTSGPVTFLHRFSASKREIAPNGRRGSLMLSMDVRHPDATSFVESKRDLSSIAGANISLRIDDEFMEAVEADATYEQRWPVEGAATVTRSISARQLWDRLVESAWASAEPGLLFWDRQHRYSTSSIYPGYRNVSTNPCGEIAMQGGDSCRLVTLNLASHVRSPWTAHAALDYDALWRTTYEAMRLADTLVDLEIEAIDALLQKIHDDPEPDQVKAVERDLWLTLRAGAVAGRRTGLGFTGLGDVLAALGLPYGGDEALSVVERIMRTKCDAEFTCSIDLAIERGPFAGWDPDTDATSEFVEMLEREMPELASRMRRWGRRNVSISTVPPCGTLAILSKTSSGIEPAFRTEYSRRRRVKHDDGRSRADFVDANGDAWQTFQVLHPGVQAWLDANPGSHPAESPYTGSTAEDLDWMDRLRVQEVVQRYTTHSISSTLNLPSSSTTADVDKIFRTAWRLGLKGLTIYRDGCRDGVLVAAPQPPAAAETEPPQVQGDVEVCAVPNDDCEACQA